MTWQLQEAKNKLSEVLDRARDDGPQTITRHGRQVAVMLSYEDYRKLSLSAKSLVEFFRESPLVGLPDMERETDDTYRDLDL